MTNLTKWNVSIEYGPTAADVHDIVVEASSVEDARKKAKKWAKDNNIKSPMIGEPSEDNYDDILDWTEDEEEAFLHIIEINDNTDER